MSHRTKRRISTRSSSSSSSPSTPIEDEDPTQAAAWHSDEDEIPPPFPSKWKGKGREVDGDHPNVNGGTAYPPAAEEEIEARQVMNNLRNWEYKERQKRRLTRDIQSSLASQQPTSVVDDVSRRASTMWKSVGGRHKSKRPSGSDHQVLQDDEFEADLDDGHVQLMTLGSNNPASPTETPTPTQTHKALPDVSEPPTPTARNPFADPMEEGTAKDPQGGILVNGSVIMDPIPTPPIAEVSALGLTLTSSPTSTEPPPQTRQPAPPQPLSIPPPKTPPPFPRSPGNTREEPTAVPDLIDDEGPGKHRWWTEWLCGCTEGPDRGGDNQAGRTNPFE